MDIVRGTFTIIDKIFHNSQNSLKFPEITVEKNLIYDLRDPAYCSFDLYYDKKQLDCGPLPIFINIHGGGFVKGDKIHRQSFAGIVATAGWFVVNVNYRLAPEHSFPTALQDVFRFLNKLPELSKTYVLNTDIIVLSGDSAGAYYAAAAYSALLDDTVRQGLQLADTGIKPSGLASFSGIYDLESVFNVKLLGVERRLASLLFGEKVLKDKAQIKNNRFRPYFSPIEHVNANWGKIFLSYSTRDIFVKGQGEALIKVLQQNNLPYVVDVGETVSENHCYHLMLKSKSSKRCITKFVEYLTEIKALKV